MASRFPISRWSLLALATAVIGGGATLGADQVMMLRWVGSGEQFPISERVEVEFDEGTYIVYYQSREGVPVPGHARLYLFNHDGQASPVQPANEVDAYHAPLAGWSGRAMWEVAVTEPGLYEVWCFNTSYPSDDDVPHDDRIVIDKHPESIDDVLRNGSFVRFGGAAITIMLVAGFYIQHIRTVGRSTPSHGAIPINENHATSGVNQHIGKPNP